MGSDQRVIEWIENRLVPVPCKPARTSTKPLFALLASLANVRVLAFGDSTHGTQEFFALRSHLLKLMIKRLQVRALAIEASASACSALDDYVCGAPVRLADALTGLKALAWNVEEFAALLRWLRRYNRSSNLEHRVRIYGFDIWNTQGERERILTFLQRFAPDKLAVARQLFDRIAASESGTIMRACKVLDRNVQPQFRALKAAIETLSATDNPPAMLKLGQVLQDVDRLGQWISANLSTNSASSGTMDKLSVTTFDNLARSRFMAENLIKLVERLGDDSRIAIWAHIFHLGIGTPDGRLDMNMGARLRDVFGERYYVFFLEFGHGTYLAREHLPDDRLGDFRLVDAPEPNSNAAASLLGKLKHPSFAIDLRLNDLPQSIADWLEQPRPIHMTGWCYSDPPSLEVETSLRRYCDGMLFTRSSVPTTPTPEARRQAASGLGH